MLYCELKNTDFERFEAPVFPSYVEVVRLYLLNSIGEAILFTQGDPLKLLSPEERLKYLLDESLEKALNNYCLFKAFMTSYLPNDCFELFSIRIYQGDIRMAVFSVGTNFIACNLANFKRMS